MKHLVPAIFWIIFSFLMISVSQAQSKKQLRQELARLEVKLNELQRENQKLLHQKEDLEQELFTKQELNRFLQREIARLREEIDATNSKYEALSAKLDQFEQQYALEAAPSRPPRVAITPAVEVSYAQVNEPAPLGLPRAKETGCAYLSDRLQNNQSYSLDYEPQPANRWGVQVFAFTSLCQAEKRARDFAAQHPGAPTFIRPKVVNNRRLYAVVYGAWNDSLEAQSYRQDYVNAATDPISQGAFIVQH